MPRSVRLASDVLVGRDEELLDVLKTLRDIADGRPAVVAVSGAAGLGKTRFVQAMADHLRTDGARVMIGSCLDLRAGAPPYAALVGAFRSVDPPAVQVLDALTGAVDMRRARLFELLRSTTVALARSRPTVLVVEDVHWSDRITRDALLYLASLAREGRWGLVLTFREDEVAARPAVREFLDALHSATAARVALDALSPQQVGAQVTGIRGKPTSPDDAARVHHRSGGIPLLVEEVLAAETAGITGVPGHLRDLLVARVRMLGAKAARVVEVVAVVGQWCDERVVASALGLGRAVVAAALDRAASADILTADANHYRMRHDLLREAVYDALPPARRRRLHHQVATALGAARRPDVAALAHHWYQADEPAQAARANLAAVALAERVHAPAAVRTYLQRALEHFDALPVDQTTSVGGRSALLARAAEAAWLSGAFQQAVTLAEEGLDGVEDPAELAVRLERLARYRWVSGDGGGALHAHEQSVAALPQDALTPVRARVLSGYAWHLAMAMRTDAARRWSDRALQAADASGEPLQRCRALLAWGLARLGEEEGLATLWEARDLAVHCDTGDELGRAHAALDLSLRRPGRAAERVQVLRDGLGYATAHGLGRSYGLVMTYLLAEVLLQLGRWDEAGQMLRGVTAGEATGVPAMFAHAFEARLAAARGQPAVAVAYADRVATLGADMPEQPYPLAIARCALAESCLWAGDVEEATTHAERARAVATDPVAVAEADVIHARAAADLAGRARMLGQPTPTAPDTGGDTYRVLAARHPLAGTFATTVRAELSRQGGRRDPQPWRDAVAAWSKEDDPYRVAYCRWRLAHALLATRAGRREARQALDAAHRTAARLGARPLLEATQSLATAARIRLSDENTPAVPVTVAVELGLTHRELEIVPFLVAGRTNAEIADVLVISPRTVGVHVSRILRKLGAARRTEAADIARRRGLVDS